MSTRHMKYRDWVSTTEAAKLCGCSHMTIIRCFDSGKLEGYRVPGSRHRRIPKTSLVAFAEENGYPNSLLHGDPELLEEATESEEKPRALVVENDLEIAAVIKKTLEKNNWEVEIVENGFDAGFQAAAFTPSLILLDIMLPGLDGREVCRQLRKHAELKETKILVVTGLTDEKSKQEISDAGADDYLAKPFSIKNLLAKITALVPAAETEALQRPQRSEGGHPPTVVAM